MAEAGWRSSKDALLLKLAERSFDVFVTIDRSIESQQDLMHLSLGAIIAHVRSNNIESYRPLFPTLLHAVERVKPGQAIHIHAR